MSLLQQLRQTVGIDDNAGGVRIGPGNAPPPSGGAGFGGVNMGQGQQGIGNMGGARRR